MEVFYLYIKQLQTVPMAMHACVCVYMHACVHACMCNYIRNCTYTYVCMHVNVKMQVWHMCVAMCVCMCKYCIAGNFDGEKF